MADDFFPANLTYYRIAAGLSLTDLAKRSGVDQTLIGRYERGKAFPGRANRDALCAALGVSFAQLVAGPPPEIWPAGAAPPPAVRRTPPPARIFPRDARVVRIGAFVGANPARGADWLDREAAEGQATFIAIGDCLAPDIEENDILLVDLHPQHLRPGQFVVVIVHNEWHLKQVIQRTDTTTYLSSKRGELVLPEEGAELVGVVVRITQDKPSSASRMNSPKTATRPVWMPVATGAEDD